MYPTGYVRNYILFKERFHLWNYPQDLWDSINEEQLVALFNDSSTPPPGIVLEAALKSMVIFYGIYDDSEGIEVVVSKY